jgi:ParB-like chromosome segregation protein Spo0J
MKFKNKTVPLGSINVEDMSFVVTAGRNMESLQASINKVGLVNPPYLHLSEADGQYQIVCGYLRIKATIALGLEEIPAEIFEPKTEKKELFLFSLYDNLSHRNFNPIENSNVIEKLLNYCSKETIIETYLPLLGLPPHARALKNILSIIDMENEIKEGIIRGTITEKSAVRLSGMEKQDRLSLFRLLCRANLSSSKQTDIIENCQDIALRDNMSIKEVAKHEEIEKILKQDRLTLSQKGDRIRQWLRKKLFPRLSRSEERFSNLRKKLALPDDVKITPPAFFEGGTYRLQIDFKTAEGLKKAAGTLKTVSESSLLKKALE